MRLKTFALAITFLMISGYVFCQDNHPMIGNDAPDFQLNDLNSNEVILSELLGNIIILHFATTWCPYCNAEAPHLEKLYNNYKTHNVRVFVVDIKEDQELVKAWAIDRHKYTIPVLLDLDGQVATNYAPSNVLPDLPRHEVPIASNLIIDKKGKIQFYSLLDSKNFDAKLTELTIKLKQLIED